jgi:DNA ligase (NAD+)
VEDLDLPKMNKQIIIPTNCPSCGSSLIISGEYLLCPNESNCFPQCSGKIRNWISELNILEWGNSLIEKLVQSGKVTTIADLYKLSIDDLSNLDRMGKKSAKKCYDTLWANTNLPLDVFIGALSIPMIGQSTIKLLIKNGYDTLCKLQALDATMMSKVSGVGPIKAKSLVDGLVFNKHLIADILRSGVTIKEVINGKLTNKSFAITGSLTIKRADVESMIKEHGGEVKKSVSKGLSYLIISDPSSMSSKAVAARKLGTILINESEFLDMVKL